MQTSYFGISDLSFCNAVLESLVSSFATCEQQMVMEAVSSHRPKWRDVCSWRTRKSHGMAEKLLLGRRSLGFSGGTWRRRQATLALAWQEGSSPNRVKQVKRTRAGAAGLLAACWRLSCPASAGARPSPNEAAVGCLDESGGVRKADEWVQYSSFPPVGERTGDRSKTQSRIGPARFEPHYL